MIVEELKATSPPLAATDPNREAAECVGRCKSQHASPTPEERIAGTCVEWARLVAADPGKTCGHWISWECLEHGLEAALERDDDDDVDEAIRVSAASSAVRTRIVRAGGTEGRSGEGVAAGTRRRRGSESDRVC